MSTARWQMSEALAKFALAQPSEFSKAHADLRVSLGRVLREANAEIEVAADKLMLAGWKYTEMMLVTYAENHGLTELCVVPRPGVKVPVFEVRTGTPTEANGWTISIAGRWLRDIPKPRKYEGTFRGIPVYSDETVKDGEMVLEQPRVRFDDGRERELCQICGGLSGRPDCVCDAGYVVVAIDDGGVMGAIEPERRLRPLSEVAREGCFCGGYRGWGEGADGDEYCFCFAGLLMMARDGSVDFDDVPEEHVRAVVIEREHADIS